MSDPIPVGKGPAVGTGLDDLVGPCGDPLRPANPPPSSGVPVGVTLSGGGFRATFTALGALRCLADCGLLQNVRYVSSVSGGSVANGMLATRWPKLRDKAFTAAVLDREVIDPMSTRVSSDSLKRKLVLDLWRTIGSKTRTDILARAFDDWFFDGATLPDLDPACRWIFNAANLMTGSRFAFERDVVGDYVLGLAPTAGSGLTVSKAVAASAAVPGAFPPMKLRGVQFPCPARGHPLLLDGGTYDNTGLEALDSEKYHDVFLVAVNAGGVLVTGSYGKLPIVRDLQRANSLLYRQSTALRTRWMVERFKTWARTPPGDPPPRDARRGVLFGLSTTVDDDDPPDEFHDFVRNYPEVRTYDGKDLAFVPTVFDKLDRALVRRLVYRGWWLTGANLARWHPGFAPLPVGTSPPPSE